MKKKLLLVTLCTGIVLSTAACGSSNTAVSSETTSSVSEVESSAASSETTENASEVESSAAQVTKDLADGDYSDMGDGTFFLSTSGGTSENGDVPVVYASKDDSLIQIGYTGREMNGGSLSYIYIDGMLSSKEQIADSQGSINLSGDFLSVGTHKVEVVQYTDDSTDSDMTCYKSASYEIKEK